MRSRRTGLFVVAASALLTLAFAAGWVRSHLVLDMLAYTTGHDWEDPTDGQMPHRHDVIRFGCSSMRGHVTLWRSVYTSYSLAPPGPEVWTAGEGWERRHIEAEHATDRTPPAFWRSAFDWRALGLGVYVTGRMGETIRVVEAPYWLLCALAASPGVFVGNRRRVRRRRIRRGQCIDCGYDLRHLQRKSSSECEHATAVCPECGSAWNLGPGSLVRTPFR